MTTELFESKLLMLGYCRSTGGQKRYTYEHTHGKMIVKFYDNDTIKIFWKPEDSARVMHYYGFPPQTSLEINVIIELLRLNLNI